METRTCRQCGTEFQVPHPSSKRTNCSPTCRGVKSKQRTDAGTRKVPWITVTCPCGKEFEVPPWKARGAPAVDQRIMCSHGCYLKYRRPGTGRRPAGRKFVNSDGYVIIYVPPEERPPNWRDKRTQDAEHRVVMRKMIGRDLLPGENVHHINGIRTDNRPENLELWVERQPKGQAAHDLLAWAREIIARYEPIEEAIHGKALEGQ